MSLCVIAKDSESSFGRSPGSQNFHPLCHHVFDSETVAENDHSVPTTADTRRVKNAVQGLPRSGEKERKFVA